MTIQRPYIERSRAYLAQASEELAKGDLRRASQRGWDAAATLVKAVAKERGWPDESHHDLYSAVSAIAEEAHDDTLRSGFLAAFSLAGNAGDNWFPKSFVELALEQATEVREAMGGGVGGGTVIP